MIHEAIRENFVKIRITRVHEIIINGIDSILN